MQKEPSLKPARSVHPGAILKRELTARGLNASDIVYSQEEIERVLSEEAGISPAIAKAVACALGGTPDLWFVLQEKYDAD